jgi:glycosyltransferase involved in cell wall biosynthesis
MAEKSIAFYLSHPIQYLSPLLVKLSGLVQVDVVYYSDVSVRGGMDKGFGQRIKWDTPVLEGYRSSFVKNYAGNRPMDNRFLDAVNPGVFGTIPKEQARIIVINGWGYCSDWLVMIAAKIAGKKIWLRAESPLHQELRKSKSVRLIKKWLLGKLLFRFFTDKCLFIGSESQKFFQFYGVPETRLIYTPYAVDNDFFSGSWRNSQPVLEKIKAQLGLPVNKKIILFTGKFIEKKRPLDLLKAFQRINTGQYCLVMVGDGELKPRLTAYIEEHALRNVVLAGFINQTKIPDYYAAADVFVMCSGMGETWGLSVNEAMNFEKPVVVSATCGCSTDLVKHGINGYIFEEGNIEQLSGYLSTLLEDEHLRNTMGIAAGRHIKNFSLDVSVHNICNEIY